MSAISLSSQAERKKMGGENGMDIHTVGQTAKALQKEREREKSGIRRQKITHRQKDIQLMEKEKKKTDSHHLPYTHHCSPVNSYANKL